LQVAYYFFPCFVLEQNPIEYPDAPWKPSKQVYVPGEKLTFTFTRCAKYGTTVDFTSRLVRVDKQKYDLQPDIFIEALSVYTESGCNTVTSLPKKLPTSLPSGIYRIELEISVKGRFKTYQVKESTQDFQIVKIKQAN